MTDYTNDNCGCGYYVSGGANNNLGSDNGHGSYTDSNKYTTYTPPNSGGALGGCGSGSSGGYTITYPYPYTVYPVYPYWPWNVPSSWPYPYYQQHSYVYTTITAPQYTYKTMELPRKGIPTQVLINGLPVTLGPLGTDVDCAYTDTLLVFAPGVTEGKALIVLEYPEGSYSYVLQSPATKHILDLKLVSASQK